MSQDEFMKMFQYVREMREEMNRQFENTMSKEDGDRILTLLDELHGKTDIDDTERLAMTRQLDRHEDWIEKASVKLGVKYDPSATA